MRSMMESTAESTAGAEAHRSLERRWLDRPALSPIGAPVGRAKRDASRRVLLAAISPAQPSLAATIERAGSNLDWNWLFDRAVAHKVGAMLVGALERCALLDRIPPALAGVVEQIRELAEHRDRLAGKTLNESLAALEAEGIRTMVLKGPVVAAQLYGDNRCRPCSDIDLLVPREQVDMASKALEEVGYQLSLRQAEQLGIPSSRQREYQRRTRHELTFVKSGRMHVELHWSLLDPGTPAIPDSLPWRHEVATTVRGRPLRTLDPVATLVHLAAHAVNLGPYWGLRLLHLADVAWSIHLGECGADGCTDPAGTEYVARAAQVASEWRCSRHLDLALRVVHRLFPSAIERAGATPPRRRWRPIDSIATPGRVVDQLRSAIPVVRTIQRVAVGTVWEGAIGRSPFAVDGIARRALRRVVPALERRRAGPDAPPPNRHA